MLLHYAQAAPLAKIVQEFAQAKDGAGLATKLDSIEKQADELRDSNTTPDATLNAFEPKVMKLENDLTALDMGARQIIKDETEQVRRRWNLRPAEYT